MVDGSGTTTSAVSYAGRDDYPLKGKSYYRLKQTDFNGAYSYSQVKVVNNADRATVQFQIYPNPTADRITIEGSESELDQVRLYDMRGHDVTPMARAYTNNNTRVMIDLSELNAGMYLVKTKTVAEMVLKQ